MRKAWLEYLARFPHVNDYFRSASQYRNQISVVGGKKAGTDINLYKLFVEQCLNLLKPEGQLGLVVPGSLYSDLGAKQLRATLFENNTLRALFGFSNERYLFEGVHHSFKICLLVATREGVTDRFEAAFRINPREAVNVENIASFLRDRREHIEMTTELVRRTSPDSLSVMEFKSATDVAIVEKMLKSPLLGKAVEGCWSVELCREFHMTDDSGLFKNKPGDGRVPLYEGKGIHQFNLHYAEPRYWVDREEAREAVGHVRLRRAQDAAKAAGAELDEVSLKRLSLDCDAYRLGFRKYARNTDERTMIATVVAQDSFAGESLTLHRPIRDTVLKGKLKEVPTLTEAELLFVVAMLNSFSVDWFLRLRVSSTINMFYVYQLPVPRLTAGDARFDAIVKRAARLTCTTPEFDALAKAVKLKSHKDGATHPEERDQLRAEIDGLVAHLYGLTEEEFAHVVRTFPVVHEAVRVGAMNAYRAVARGDVT